jgi:hypothetical protein
MLVTPVAPLQQRLGPPQPREQQPVSLHRVTKPSKQIPIHLDTRASAFIEILLETPGDFNF